MGKKIRKNDRKPFRVPCEWCGRTVYPVPGRGRVKRYCSRSCQALAYRARKSMRDYFGRDQV